MPETPFENDRFFGSQEVRQDCEWINKAEDHIKKSRRWIRNSLIGLGAILGLAGATMVTGAVYFNSDHYKISRLNPNELERMHWRSSWIKDDIGDPCKIMREENDHIAQQNWKCHEFPIPPKLKDLPDSPPKYQPATSPNKPTDSKEKGRVRPKRRVKKTHTA